MLSRADILAELPEKEAAQSGPDRVDYGTVMQANLTWVFGERDEARRLEAIDKLYADDAVFFEPHATAVGKAQIASAVTALLAHIPSQFVFASDGPALGHNRMGRLRWRLGPPKGPTVQIGTDIVCIKHGRHHQRVTKADADVQSRVLAFHEALNRRTCATGSPPIPPTPPRLQNCPKRRTGNETPYGNPLLKLVEGFPASRLAAAPPPPFPYQAYKGARGPCFPALRPARPI